MMMSPDVIRAARSFTVCSVAWPAGTMIQTARGWFSLASRSSSDSAPMAPSPTSVFTLSALTSQTTHSCPPPINRRTMLAPMRPRPIIPSCMALSFCVRTRSGSDGIYNTTMARDPVATAPGSDTSSPLRHKGVQQSSCKRGRLRSSLDKELDKCLDRGSQPSQSVTNIRSQMHPQRAPATFVEYFKIATGLRCFYNSESVVLIRDRQVGRLIASDLQKDSTVGTTLISLAG